MGKIRLVQFGTTSKLRKHRPSIRGILPTLLSEITKEAVTKGQKFDFDTEWYEFDTGNHFYQYEVDQHVGMETQLLNLLSGLREQGIDATLVNTEKLGSYERYVLDSGM
jgi:hypothetical protein